MTRLQADGEGEATRREKGNRPAGERFAKSRRTLFSDAFSELSRLASRMFTFLFLDVRVLGVEKLPRNGPCLVASTHQSYLDPWLLAIMLPRLSYYLAKEELFRVPVLGWLLRTYNTLPVPRGSSTARAVLKRAIEVLEHDEVMVMFPEGTRSPDGRLQPIQGGLSLIVRRTGAPVLPVLFIGAHRVWPRDRRFPRIRLLPRIFSRGKLRIRIVFGDLVEPCQRESGEGFRGRLEAAYRALAVEQGVDWMVDNWPPAATPGEGTPRTPRPEGGDGPGSRQQPMVDDIQCVTDEGHCRLSPPVDSQQLIPVGRLKNYGRPEAPLPPASTWRRELTQPQSFLPGPFAGPFRWKESHALPRNRIGSQVGRKGL